MAQDTRRGGQIRTLPPSTSLLSSDVDASNAHAAVWADTREGRL